MLEKPNLHESLIEDCLRNQYGLENVTLKFLLVGNDVNTAVYRVNINKQEQMYLKLRKGDFNIMSVIVPHLLKEHDIKQVIAPVLTRSQQEWTKINEFSLALYPYIDGEN